MILLLIYNFVCFITNHMILVSGEYKVNDVVPSYLYHKFDNVKENIFPEDVRMKVSLSRMEGTLLYTIDKNMNQMIVTLQTGLSITLRIEFRKKETFISIPELCKCQICRFEILDLRIEIKDEIEVQCNTGSMKSYPFDNTVAVNKAYNIPKYNTSSGISSSNEAHLWLVNTPYDTGIYPNTLQLSGCIFNVWYKKKTIKFKEIVGNITNHCPNPCKDNICNGGECLQTYNESPVCNCTKSFLNGEYCNHKISPLNFESMHKVFKFTMFKVSWNSSSNEILKLSNSQFQILLGSSSRLLKFEYHYWNQYHVNISSILSRRYKMNQDYILIVIFHNTFIDIQYFNGSWSRKMIPSVTDLSKEEITSISLQSGDGRISLAYKNDPTSYTWNILNITDYEEIKLRSPNDKSLTENKPEKFLIVILVIVSIITTVVLCGIIIFILYKTKSIPFCYSAISPQPHSKTESESVMANVGEIYCMLDRFSVRKTQNEVIFSPYFYSHSGGYKLRLRVHPGGYANGKGTHLSVVLVICEGEYDDKLQWPCKHSIKISIINQSPQSEHYSVTLNQSTDQGFFNKPRNHDTAAFERPQFIPHQTLQSIVSLTLNDSVVIKCTVKAP